MHRSCVYECVECVLAFVRVYVRRSYHHLLGVSGSMWHTIDLNLAAIRFTAHVFHVHIQIAYNSLSLSLFVSSAVFFVRFSTVYCCYCFFPLASSIPFFRFVCKKNRRLASQIRINSIVTIQLHRNDEFI